MSDYDFRPGGSLKLKGKVDGGVSKRKKKLSKSMSKEKHQERTADLDALVDEDDRMKGEFLVGSSRNSPALASSDRKTSAEKRFEEVQKRRLAEKVAKQAHTTHKDRVHEFNSKLEALSEHHDIPKVGPG